MTIVHRVLPLRPFQSFDEYVAAGGGRGLDLCGRVEPMVVVDAIRDSVIIGAAWTRRRVVSHGREMADGSRQRL